MTVKWIEICASQFDDPKRLNQRFSNFSAENSYENEKFDVQLKTKIFCYPKSNFVDIQSHPTRNIKIVHKSIGNT